MPGSLRAPVREEGASAPVDLHRSARAFLAPVELPLVGSVDLPSFSTKTVDLPSLPELPDVPLPDVPEEFEDAASIAIVLAGMVFAVACSEPA